MVTFNKSINYNITIEPAANGGFIVSVGCCRLAYSDKDELLHDINEYLSNPAKTEKAYYGDEKTACAIEEPEPESALVPPPRIQ